MKARFKNIGATLCKLNNKNGNSLPVILVVILVVLLLGGAVAYSAVQLFSTVRNEEHNQMTYIAAESAIERSIANLEEVITKWDFARNNNISYTNNTDYINEIVNKLNGEISGINLSYEVPVYADSSMNKANVKISFSWDGATYTEEDDDYKLKFPLKITAVADMENGMFKSYERKAVAVREFEVYKPYKPFKIKGAAYAIGDLVAKGSGESTIEGDVYVFGTGLDKPNRMQQYYMGGICATENAILHIRNGSAFTRSLLRVGTFDEEASGDECAIVVDRDVVAEGIQAFGHDDSIVIIRDAYTFDDIEMNGANSYIAVNGNYYGMNRGDQKFHDTSSAIINIAPRYEPGDDSSYVKSRIVVNGSTFVNGTTFVMEVNTGEGVYQLENVALAWEGEDPVPVYMTREYENTRQYIEDLRNKRGIINGFSVLLGNVGWTQNSDLTTNWSTWRNWIHEIRSKAAGFSNILTVVPDKIEGFCSMAMAANNKIYFSEEDIKIPDSVTLGVAESVEELDRDMLKKYIYSDWADYSDVNMGMPKGLEELMGILNNHVQFFAIKEFPATQKITNPAGEEVTPDISYTFVPNMHGSSSKTEFLRVRDELDEIDTTIWKCVAKYGSGGGVSPVNLLEDLNSKDYNLDDYLLVINLNPDRDIVIEPVVVEESDEEGEEGAGEETQYTAFNGIIFTMGKVIIRNGAKVNGTVIAAGKGYDPVRMVGGSAAEFYNDDESRIPRIVGDTNINNFKNWDYAAIILDNGSIYFPGRDALLENFNEENEDVVFSDILKEIF